VQVEVVQTAGSVAPMALIAGEVDFSIMSAFLLIPVSVQGGDVVMLGGFGRYATMTLISRSDSGMPKSSRENDRAPASR
jgi:ABC-type nitrate/sulfonate/bicarbonate transport system substrate-binding protein